MARLAFPLALEADVCENKSGEMLNRVQKRLNLQLNSWSPCRVFALFSDSQTTPIVGISYFFCHPGGPRAVYGRGGERRRRPSELQFASPPVATRNGLARPAHRRARDDRKESSPCQAQDMETHKNNGKSPTNCATDPNLCSDRHFSICTTPFTMAFNSDSGIECSRPPIEHLGGSSTRPTV